MTREDVLNDYFDWLYESVCKDRFSSQISYRRLLSRLHGTPFIFSIPRDENRANDGVDLRYIFGYEYSSPAAVETFLDMPCSVLEVMVALAIRCEDTIMDDPRVGDRTGQWFWCMVKSLGLGSMSDELFDSQYVDQVIDRFLHREYEPDGRGGLFTVRGCKDDLRDVEIWYQLCWYLDSIT